jgi:tetratricopeptide (TPR) repeat protein
VAGEAFTNVGIFMASSLTEITKGSGLEGYDQKGPIAFFADYIRLSRSWPSEKEAFKFSNPFSDLILGWEADWNKTYSDYTKNLVISRHIDLDEMDRKLTETFAETRIYPDFTQNMIGLSRYFLESKQHEKAFRLLDLGFRLYPFSQDILSHLALAHLWTGGTEKAAEFFRQAFYIDPEHPSIGLQALENMGELLLQVKKFDEIAALADIFMELRPQNPIFIIRIGDLFLRMGRLDQALLYYQEALDLNPSLEGVAERIEAIKKFIR